MVRAVATTTTPIEDYGLFPVQSNPVTMGISWEIEPGIEDYGLFPVQFSPVTTRDFPGN